jgi:hypothetical protein
MMYKVTDEADNANENVQENPVFGNEVEWSAILVQRQMAVAKAKERGLLLFKWTEPNKDEVLHSYTVTIPKTKTKLFDLAICYILSRTSFRMVANIISCTYEVLSNPSLHFCIHHHVSNFVRVVCVVNP